MSNVTTHSFTNCGAQAAALAERVAAQLREAVAARGTAVIAVSGGVPVGTSGIGSTSCGGGASRLSAKTRSSCPW